MPGFAGFDRSDYPGNQIMNWLKANTNLVWCGYYLAPVPSHHSTTWMTKRAALVAAGWGIAPLYVGQQVTGPGSLHPSSATGMADGKQAASLMSSEGFSSGSFVYLDLENGPPVTQPQIDYVANWCDTVGANGYQPGVYCSHLLALSIHTLRSACRIWAFNVLTTQAHPVPKPFPDPNPSGCGYIGAYVWQLGQHCLIGVPPATLSTLNVDLDSAIAPDPGAP
jgi:Domain of unknown function (DUF1906)